MIILLFLFVAVFLILFFSLTSRDRSVLFNRENTFEYQGTSRKYLISSADKITSESRVIVGLHGFGDTPMRFAYYTGLHNAAKSIDIVIYPRASQPKENQKLGWNADFCCGSGWVNKVDDIGYILGLSQTVARENGINEENIYVTGFSNGGLMTQKIAAEKPESLKAAASSSGSAGANDKKYEPKKPVPILLLHGEKDTIVPFNGGPGKSDPDFSWLSHYQTLDIWKNVNGDKAETKPITYSDDTHQWHDWRLFNFWHRTPRGSVEIIKFFDKY